MPVLNPLHAALFADAVYKIVSSASTEQAMKDGGADTASGGLAVPGGSSNDGFAPRQESSRGVAGGPMPKWSPFALILDGQGRYAQDVVIAVRGTRPDVKDVLTDIDAAKVPAPVGAGFVHLGFSRTYLSVKNDLEQKFAKNPAPANATFHIIGHSLGGAVATLLAQYYRSSGKTVNLYTFGSPRVGDAAFRDNFQNSMGNGTIYRVYSMLDPVPWVPAYPFRHVIDPANSYTVMTGGVPHSMSTDYLPALRRLGNPSWPHLGVITDELTVEGLFGDIANNLPGPARAALMSSAGAITEEIRRSWGRFMTPGATTLDILLQALHEHSVEPLLTVDFTKASAKTLTLGLTAATTSPAIGSAHLSKVLLKFLIKQVKRGFSRALDRAFGWVAQY